MSRTSTQTRPRRASDRRLHRTTSAVLLALTATLLALVTASPSGPAAAAATDDPPATVSADGLPTWQLNGVVWSQAVVGTTVYATGSFTKARPPGVAEGGAGEVDAQNIFAYDITTGARVASFSHSLSDQGRVITASSDGSRIYVGGDFTEVDGQVRGHVAAFDTATGNLVGDFKPSLDGTVRGLAAGPSNVFIGGSFSKVGSTSRRNLAKVSSAGVLTSWAASADDGMVRTLVLTTNRTRLVVGGAFTTLNKVSAYGMGSLDTTSGATESWAANKTVRDATNGAAITSLRTDGSLVYGSGYQFQNRGTSNFEGTFAADATTGVLAWVNDCHGDTYDMLPVGQVLYSAGHAHDCSAIGEFPQTSPIHYTRLQASTTYATGVNAGPDSYGFNYEGLPAAHHLPWFPTLAYGTFTGQKQAAWSMAGSGDYVAVGGEFPSVNGVAQQSLVRFAARSVSSNPTARGVSGSNLAVQARSVSSGAVRVSWPSQWDTDDGDLTYRLYRDGNSTTPIYTTTRSSRFWSRPTIVFTDKGLTTGSSHTYQVRASDADDNRSWSPVSDPVTVSSTTLDAYADGVLDDGATSYWRFGEGSGTAVADTTGGTGATAGTGVARGLPGVLPGNSAAAFDGDAGSVATDTTLPTPSTFSVEAYVRTTTHAGGEIVGYGTSATGSSATNDRVLYMDTDGHLVFGVNDTVRRTLSTSSTYNDGAWHQVVGSLDQDGMSLYVDGALVRSTPKVISARSALGYWRIGGDSLASWPKAPSAAYLAALIDEVAVYPTALTPSAVQRHFTDSGLVAPNKAPAAQISAQPSYLDVALDGSASGDDDGTVAGYDWAFGDGRSGTGARVSHSYAEAGTYTVTLTVTDDDGATGRTTKQVKVTAPPPFAADSFSRKKSSGWGAADRGGAWKVSGTKSLASVSGGRGVLRMRKANSGPSMFLPSAVSSSTDLLATTSLSKRPKGGSTGGVLEGFVVRRPSGRGDYRAQVRIRPSGAVRVSLVRTSASGSATTIRSEKAVPRLTYKAGMALRVRVQAFGTSPTTIRVRVWKVGTAEPTSWLRSTTDRTSTLQRAGAVGFSTFMTKTAKGAPIDARLDDLVAGSPASTG